MFAHGETVTRVRAGRKTSRYNAEATDLDWSAAGEVDIPGWLVAQDATSEPAEVGRAAIDADFTLYRSDPADITSLDRLVVRGLTCEVVGRPFEWVSGLTGWRPGQVVKCKVREG